MIDTFDIARVCHEVNRAYCLGIGDASQESWIDCPDWQRKSAIEGVSFKLANPNSTPEALHANWCKGKIADGWVYGPTKDAEKKTHNCLVDYEDLPVEQITKDYLFAAVVLTLRDIEEAE